MGTTQRINIIIYVYNILISSANIQIYHIKTNICMMNNSSNPGRGQRQPVINRKPFTYFVVGVNIH